jgi:hypothetical protein
MKGKKSGKTEDFLAVQPKATTVLRLLLFFQTNLEGREGRG